MPLSEGPLLADSSRSPGCILNDWCWPIAASRSSPQDQRIRTIYRENKMYHISRWCIAITTSLLVLAGGVLAQSQPTEIPFHSTTIVRLASTEDAAALLGNADSWVRDLSPFDRSARIRQPVDPGQDAFLKFAAAQAQAWTPEQIDTLRMIVESAGRRIESLDLQLSLPPIVMLVRTSGNEESHAAYTRENAIILPDAMLSMPTDQLEQLFLHELFHVMSGYEPAIRRPLYGIIGHSPCLNVPFPEELLPLKITNPDAFHRDFCIDIQAAGTSQTVTPILYAKGPYTEGDFFDWLVFRLMAVERSGDDWRPVRDENGLRMFGPGEVSGFFESIGKNTNYIIHPEEIMADNFAFAIVERDDLPNPEISARLLDELGSRIND